jgi:hypothetical protein
MIFGQSKSTLKEFKLKYELQSRSDSEIPSDNK